MRNKGFTLLELIVVIAIITVLAGILAPVVKSSLDDAKVAKVLALVDTAKKAAQTCYYHTDQFPRQGVNGVSTYVDLTDNDTNAWANWKGPYLDNPLGVSSNPWGGDIYINNVTAGEGASPDGYVNIGGFAAGANTDGGELVITGVPEARAEDIDLAMDGPPPGGSLDRKTDGRVEYSVTSGVAEVRIFLYIKS